MRIRMEDGHLIVPDEPEIVCIDGDGVGSEISPLMRSVVDAAVESAYGGRRRIAWIEALAGGRAMEECGTNLPDRTLDLIRSSLVAIKGPLMTPVGKGARSINVALRQALDLYVCLRPVRYYEGTPAPVRHPELVDMVVFRENTEDIYAGIEWPAGSDEAARVISFLEDEMGVRKIRFPETSAIGIKPVSREGSERLVRAAIGYAIDNGRKSVTLVHKGNIMKFTEGGFRTWGYELAEREFGAVRKDGRLFVGDIVIKDCIADAFLQNILLKPGDYDVIATMNLDGDYISDALAAQVGGIGISPGANINGMTGAAVFEATHGTAPDIAGKDIVNPLSLVLSAAMMLDYIGWKEAAAIVTGSVAGQIASRRITRDFAVLMEREGEACTELGSRAFAAELRARCMQAREPR